MPPVPRLEGAESHDGMHVDVLIQAIHIGECVVQHIVLDFPNHSVATHQIQDSSDPQVDPFLVAVSVVVGVVHDVHSDACT